MRIYKDKSGQIALQIIMFSTIATILLTGFLSWGYAVSDAVIRSGERFSAEQIAEAGIEYYRWHLAHDPHDFQDGTGHAGPYTHIYSNKNGNQVGQFILDITPPVQGSTIVTVQSTGLITEDPKISKILKVRMGIPSFTKFAAALNDNVRFGQGTDVYGAIYSNGGIHFDGTAHNLILSALPSYKDPDHAGNSEFGVHTHVNPPPATGVTNTFIAAEAPPSPVMNRPDVFFVGRQFPVPAIDFTGITANLTQIKADASSSGVYFPPSGASGYHIVLKTNNTFDLYLVNSVMRAPNGCVSVLGQQNWGTWSIDTGGETFVKTYNFPSNNLIFVEDNLWIDGQINNAKLTIAAGVFPFNNSNMASITVNNNLLYTNFDGKDSLGLIAQGDFNVGLVSADTLTIDGALIAQNGRAGRDYYKSGTNNQGRCSPYDTRSTLNLYGMLMSYGRYGFAYTDGTGYTTRNITYDPNLLYGPPPSFPSAANTYQVISWEEIK